MNLKCVFNNVCPISSPVYSRFDTKGLLNFAFHEKLINPKGGLLSKPEGAHFLLRGGMGFPLEKRVKRGTKKSLGTFSVTGQFGMYSKVTVGKETTADVFKVIIE